MRELSGRFNGSMWKKYVRLFVPPLKAEHGEAICK